MRCLIRVQVLSLPWPSFVLDLCGKCGFQNTGLAQKIRLSNKVTSNSQNIPHKYHNKTSGNHRSVLPSSAILKMDACFDTWSVNQKSASHWLRGQSALSLNIGISWTVNTSLDAVETILITTAKRCLKIRVVKKRHIKSSSNKKRFDKECRLKRHELRKLANLKHRDPLNITLRQGYHTVLKQYKSVLTQEKWILSD